MVYNSEEYGWHDWHVPADAFVFLRSNASLRARDAAWHYLIREANTKARWTLLWSHISLCVKDIRSGVLGHFSEKCPYEQYVINVASELLPHARSSVYWARSDLEIVSAIKTVLTASSIVGASSIESDVGGWLAQFKWFPNDIRFRIESACPNRDYCFEEPPRYP